MNQKLLRRDVFRSLPALASPAGLQSQSNQVAESFQPIRALLSGNDPVTWVFTGDSITHGALHTMGWRSYPEHFAERIRWEMRRVRDIVINTGISGDTMGGLLKDMDWRVHRFLPHVVSLMMGMNDCVGGPGGRTGFRRNLDVCLDQLRARKSLLLLHTPNQIYTPATPKRSDLPAYVEIIREFAAETRVPLVDHYAHWTESRKDYYELIYLLSDGSVHPNQYGHAEFAKLL